jgi:nucleotide-binding universal stress UspA family protein
MNTPTVDVVVGIDGSPCSKVALRWAEDYARRLDGTLTLVTAWHWPMSYGVPVAYEGFDPEEDARKVVEAARADVRTVPLDRIRMVVAQGQAGDVLVDASSGSAVLIVGTRGHGGLTGALLGSTSTYCVHHARCPVVVVR